MLTPTENKITLKDLPYDCVEECGSLHVMSKIDRWAEQLRFSVDRKVGENYLIDMIGIDPAYVENFLDAELSATVLYHVCQSFMDFVTICNEIFIDPYSCDEGTVINGKTNVVYLI